jgi:hypothetical protein
MHVTALLTVTSAFSAAAPQSEWEKTIAAAEQEGQVTFYGAPGITYQNAIGAFQERFPKIRLLYVPGSGSNNAQRLMAERRAEKYLADVFVGGSGTLIEVLFDGGVLDPISVGLDSAGSQRSIALVQQKAHLCRRQRPVRFHDAGQHQYGIGSLQQQTDETGRHQVSLGRHQLALERQDCRL